MAEYIDDGINNSNFKSINLSTKKKYRFEHDLGIGILEMHTALQPVF